MKMYGLVKEVSKPSLGSAHIRVAGVSDPGGSLPVAGVSDPGAKAKRPGSETPATQSERVPNRRLGLHDPCAIRR